MKINKTLIQVVILSFTFMQITPAIAGVVATDRFLIEQSVQQERENLRAFMARENVQSLLQHNGLTVEQAQKRVDALTDAEVQMLARKYEELPAAGNAAAGILIIALFVMVLELSGLTDISPKAP